MTRPTLRSIERQLEKMQPPGRIIVAYEGEPIPAHRPQDTVVVFDKDDLDIL